MEQKAHYAVIGAFVILAILATIGFVSWLSNTQFDQQYDNYVVEFNGPVRGISQGSDVRLTGLIVGAVTKLEFDPDDPNRIKVGIQVEANLPIFLNAYAQLEPQGLTGMNYIQIYPGDRTKNRLLTTARTPAVIRGEMSQIDSFLDGGTSMLEGARSTVGRVNTLLDEQAISDFHSILDNFNQISARLGEADIDPVLITNTLLSFEKAANEVTLAASDMDRVVNDFDLFVQQDLKTLVVSAESALDGVEELTRNISGLADGGTDLTVDMRDAINRISNSGLMDLEETVDGLRRLVNSLTGITEQLDDSPAAFIAGTEREEMELPR